MIGVTLQGGDVSQTIENIKLAESLGVESVWLTSGGGGGDSLSVFAAAAPQTRTILFGTSIVPTWPRHPLVMAQQVQVIAQLAPGRFRLGIGSSHQAGMERSYGVTWQKPLSEVRQYVTVLKTLFSQGSVDFAGQFVTARGQMTPIDVPVMISALREGSFTAAGELADGAITWVCPWPYLRQRALPALRRGAAKAGRVPPPLVTHLPVCVSANREEVRMAAREQFARYGTIPFYAAMFAEAGYGDTTGELSDRLIDDLVVSGDEAMVAEKLSRIRSEGAGEIIAHPVLLGEDRQASLAKALRALVAARR